jgi:hypothetical protein
MSAVASAVVSVSAWETALVLVLVSVSVSDYVYHTT